MGPESLLTRVRADSGSDGTSDSEPERARLARIIITPAKTAHVTAQPGCPFFRHRMSAATAFMMARPV